MHVRVCIFTSNVDLVALDEKTLLSKVRCPVKEEDVGGVYITSYEWPPESITVNSKFYSLCDYTEFRLGLCRRLFRLLDHNTWIPSSLSLIPLLLCQNELLEIFLACDPDLVLIYDLHWATQLQKLIRRRYPQWSCLARLDEGLRITSSRRKYNPSAKVSIVLPTYNGSKYIRQSIESCLKQTHKNLELILVDDGSTEDIKRIISCYDDPRVKYVRHDKNLGVAEALNTGFRNSMGEYLTWTSDDNYYAENAIEEMVRFLQTYPEPDFVYAEVHTIDERVPNQDSGIRIVGPRAWLKLDNWIGACFLYKRKVYETIGEYKPEAFLAEDYDYWIRVAKKFRMQRLFRTLYYYRFHRDSLTSKHSREEVSEKVEFVKQLNRV